ncbi:MAG: transporter [Osedax symbiont Rs1]|nr:MAG: transporter [Osedax symbiont Rs1]
MQVLLILLAFVAFLTIVFEEVIHVNKAKTTLFLGALAWILLFIFPQHGLSRADIQSAFNENLLEIATLWLFLMAAMTFVAYLNHQGLIESMIYRLLPAKISEKKLLFLVSIFSFVFSSLSDNITATLVSMTLVLSLKLPVKNAIKFTVLVVFSVNSGGVSLITGDVTTLMIFLEGKVAIQDLLWLSIPSFISVMALSLMLSFTLDGEISIANQKTSEDLVGKRIAAIFLATIFATIVLNVYAQVPPVLTFLFGLSIMFLVGRFCYRGDKRDDMLEYIRAIEYDTLLFFLGILLLVGMLKEIQVLDSLVQLYQIMPIDYANYTMGLISALVDNVPLTAAVLKSSIAMQPSQWLSLTYSVGVGGSLLVIGSAAGIVAMSKVSGLNFFSYMRYFAVLLIAYTLGFIGSVLVGNFLY